MQRIGETMAQAAGAGSAGAGMHEESHGHDQQHGGGAHHGESSQQDRSNDENIEEADVEIIDPKK